ncbi:MAG: hotdog family protein [Planctomycetota bacterium]|jgi:3-hydroxyacyl-[acyl-carrier-protein] dehydratase
MRWLWIDRIIALEPDTRMVAIKNVSLAEEYLHDHFPAADGREALPVLPASLIIEGMAQTAGILVGSARQFKEKVILAKIARARLEHEVFPGETVRFEAELERIDAAGASTVGTVSRFCPAAEKWSTVGHIDLIFSHIDESSSSRGVPQDNFVFSENLNVLLRTAGLEGLGKEA